MSGSKNPSAFSRILRTAISIGLLAAALPGCFTYIFQDKRYKAGEVQDQWRSFFLFGLIGEAEVNVEDFCPDGEAAEVAVGSNGATWLVSWLTMGIYTPNKIYVRCAEGLIEAIHYEIEFYAPHSPGHVRMFVGDKTLEGKPILLDHAAQKYALTLHEVMP